MINSTQFLRHNSADSSETVRQGQVSRAAEENDKDVFSPASSSSSGLTEARLGRCLGPVKETSLPLITASHTKNHLQAEANVECLNVKHEMKGCSTCRLWRFYNQTWKVLRRKVCLFRPLVVPRFAVPAHRLLAMAGQRSSEGLNISWMGAVKSAARWDLQIRYTIFMSNLSF